MSGIHQKSRGDIRGLRDRAMRGFAGRLRRSVGILDKIAVFWGPRLIPVTGFVLLTRNT